MKDAIISECEKKGIAPVVTLHHFTQPLWWSKKGGFTLHEKIPAFINFCEKIISRFGSRIPIWCTFNEPMVFAIGGYLGKFMPPSEFSPWKFVQVNRNMFRVHVELYHLIHSRLDNLRHGPFQSWPLQVGIAHNMMVFQPASHWNLIERFAVYLLDELYNHTWLKGLIGKQIRFWIPFALSLTPRLNNAKKKKVCDFLGVNYYSKAIVCFRPNLYAPFSSIPHWPFAVSLSRKEDLRSDLDWAIYPKGLRKILIALSKYKLPIIVTENGIADRTDQLRKVLFYTTSFKLPKQKKMGISVQEIF